MGPAKAGAAAARGGNPTTSDAERALLARYESLREARARAERARAAAAAAAREAGARSGGAAGGAGEKRLGRAAPSSGTRRAAGPTGAGPGPGTGASSKGEAPGAGDGGEKHLTARERAALILRREAQERSGSGGGDGAAGAPGAQLPPTKRPTLQKRPRLAPGRAPPPGGAPGEPSLKKARALARTESGGAAGEVLENCVRVQGLHQECTAAEISTLMAPYGDVKGVRLEAGCATVEFSSAAQASATVDALGPSGRPPMLGQRVPLVVQRAAGLGGQPVTGAPPPGGGAEPPDPAAPPSGAGGTGDVGRGLITYDDL